MGGCPDRSPKYAGGAMGDRNSEAQGFEGEPGRASTWAVGGAGVEMGADAEMGQAGDGQAGDGQAPRCAPRRDLASRTSILAWDHMRERVGWLGLPVEGEDLPLEDTVGCED